MQSPPIQYTYISLSFVFILVWLIIFFKRIDLRSRLFKAGFIGMFCGSLSELWLKFDYWNPQSVLNSENTLIEDFVCGFFIVGVSCTLYHWLFNRRVVKVSKTRYLTALLFFLSGAANQFAINSMLSFSIVFLLLSALIILKQQKYFAQSIKNGIVLALMAFVTYYILFSIIFPDFWHTVLKKDSHQSGLFFFNTFPVVEILWYFSWGVFSNIFYDYIGNYEKVS
jgi:hypothetical protein